MLELSLTLSVAKSEWSTCPTGGIIFPCSNSVEFSFSLVFDLSFVKFSDCIDDNFELNSEFACDMFGVKASAYPKKHDTTPIDNFLNPYFNLLLALFALFPSINFLSKFFLFISFPLNFYFSLFPFLYKLIY